MQFMIMAVSINTHLTMVWNGRFEAMWKEKVTVNFLLNFYIEENSFHKTKYFKSFRKIES